MGDDLTYSFLESRLGNTYADRIAHRVLQSHFPEYKKYSFLDRGSDERQYCSPGVDLPVVSIMRSKYAQFPEYHTSDDNLDFISPKGLAGSIEILKKAINLIEADEKYRVKCLCEPQLGKRGLYPSISTHATFAQVKDLRNFIVYSDGNHSLLDISEKIGVDPELLYPIVEKLLNADLIEKVSST
jgi:aminopeptidase-like protein